MSRTVITTNWDQDRFETWDLIFEVWGERILDVNNQNIAVVWTELLRDLNTEWT